MNRIAVVSFDFTNTIVKLRHAPGTAYARVALEYGVELGAENLQKSFRSSFKKLWSEYPNFGRESVGCRRFWHQVVSSTLSGAGLEEHPRNENLRARISDHLYDAFATDEFWMLDESSAPVLETLSAKNLTLVVISNMDERLPAILKSLRIREHFEAVLSSYDTGITKPDRRIFDCALTLLKRNTAESAVHIGDDFENDYEGARGAGWNALWLNERRELKQIPNECVVASLWEVPQRIHRIGVSL